MKRRMLALLLALLLMVSVVPTVSADEPEQADYIYEEVDGVTYAWGLEAYIEPPVVRGYHWEMMTDEHQDHFGQIFPCPYEDHTHSIPDGCFDLVNYQIICDKEEHECQYYHAVPRFGWKKVENGPALLLVVEGFAPDNKAMANCEYVLLKQSPQMVNGNYKDENDNILETDADGNLVNPEDADKRIPASSVTVNLEAISNESGVATIYLDPTLLDPDAPFERFILDQRIDGEIYRTATRYYITVVFNEAGQYELYSITEEESRQNKTLAQWQEAYAELGEPTFVENYNADSNKLVFRNEYLTGLIDIKVDYEGLSAAEKRNVTASVNVVGSTYFGVNVDKTATFADGVKQQALRNNLMGEYNVITTAPEVEGYIAGETIIEFKYLSGNVDENEPNPNNADFILNKNHQNVEITIRYTYTVDRNFHEHTYESIVTEPTCENKGFTTYVCSDPDCNDAYVGDYTDPLGHDYDEGVEVEADCTHVAGILYTCQRCGNEKSENEGELGDHKYKETVTAPTCTAEGYTTYQCEVCGYSYTDNKVKAEDHKYKETVTKPTCTAEGYTTYQCEVCGYSYTDNKVNAEGHKYKETVTKPTCTADGYTTYKCEGCGYSYTGNQAKAEGHKYESKVVAPTTEREGYTLHTCSVCGDSYTDNKKDKLTSGNNQTSTTTNTTNTTNTNDPINTVIAKVVDDLNRPLEGSEIGIYSGKTLVAKWKCTYENVFVLDNLSKYVKEGQSATYTLKQVTAPDGFELSEDTFTLKISNRDGKTEVDVKKNTGNGSNIYQNNSVVVGNDGKQIVTFCSERRATQFEVTCQVSVDFGENTWMDSALAEQYQNKQYQFVLTWQNADGELESESILLAHGEIGVFEKEIPFDTKYEITVIDPEINFTAEFTENASGKLTAEQIIDNVVVEAHLRYVVQSDEALMLSMVIVDGQTKIPLQGASFELKDPDGLAVGTYTSREEGEFYVTDVLNVPGHYLLTQITTPRGYEMLSGGIPVEVAADYTLDMSTGTPVLIQSMTAELAHQSVVREEDGSYWVENEAIVKTEENSRKGIGFGGVLAIIGAVAAAGGAAAFVLIRKKRKVAQP